jgi:Na+-driven multidrug efflux pump
MASIGSLMVFFLNKILGNFSSTAIAVFGAYFKLQSFIFMPIFGLNNGIVPIIAFNFGARKRNRITGTMKFGGIAALLIMSAGTLLFWLFPSFLLGMFSASDEMLQIGRAALRIISLHFPIAAICILLTSVFQALGHGIYSMLNSIIRQIVVLVPAAYLLSLTENVNNVWWSFPIAEISALLVTVLFFVKVYKKELVNL